MATPTAAGKFLSAATADEAHNDPFVTTAPSAGSTHFRYSDFDSQVFALGPSASPAQARRALEAHLAETNRRMEEAGRLGTALLQQRKELEDRLEEVSKQESQGELTQELREKLAEIEREYNEVAKESARAFLPKQRVPSNEAAAASGSPFTTETRSGRRSVSPSKFETQATGSPTKFGVPNRKIRNQPTNRIHDIEFAAEISTSLIAQVRNLQALLAEKDEELKDIRIERSKLEYEAEGLQQRIKSLDESENRYKDENWNLETQIQQFTAKEREAADREKKLTQSLNIVQAEKNATQRELDEVKLNHARLVDEYAAAVKTHDIELGTAKRTMIMGESERAAMQRKIDELTGQNQELARVISASQRAKVMERESIFSMSDEDFHTAHDKSTPEGSPPPSPIKLTPRHSMLETETLKTSLSHAQRTIQSLRSNLHREKTEKLEQRRLLQEARDELEKMRSEPAPVAPKRPRKTEARELTRDFKKPPRLLGGQRSTRSEVVMEDPNWEDEPDMSHLQSSPSREPRRIETVAEQPENYEPGHETSDQAFETANEPNTETDDFHTGAEEFSSDDMDTETDSPTKRLTLRGRPPSLPPAGSMRRESFHSTASTDDDDYPFHSGTRTPPSLPPLHNKFPLRVSRGASFRRSRQASEEPAIPSSPPSIMSSIMGTPKQISQSLAAELGDFDGSDNDSQLSATPSRRSIRARTTTPPPVPPLPRVIMVDSATMTEPLSGLPSTSTGSAVGTERPMSMETVASRFSMSSYGDAGAQDMEEKLAKFPSPPTSPPKKDSAAAAAAAAAELAMSTVHSHAVEPFPGPDAHAAAVAALRSEHEEQLRQISAENIAAQAAALEALKAQHADQLTQSQAEANLAHAQELEALRSSHEDTVSKVAVEAEVAHARELEALKASHADQISKITEEIQARHAQEIGALKRTHAEQLAQTESEIKADHAAEVETLIAVHAKQMAQQESDSKAAYARDLETLELKHADELSSSKADSDATHAAEIAELEASHASQIEAAKKELKDVHAKEIDNLRATHVEQIERTKRDSDAAHAMELETLKTLHLQKIEEVKNAINATHSQEIDSLRASHAKQLDQLQKDSDAAHAAEIAALKVSHDQKLEAFKVENDTTLSKEISALKDNHAKEIEVLSSQHAAAHASEVAALVVSHDKKMESYKAESAAVLSRELAALKEAHSKEVEALNREHAAAHSQELEGFKAALAKQVESSKEMGDAAHNEQIQALNAAHAEILEAHKRDSEKSQTQAVESLKSMHQRQIEVLKSEHNAVKSKELEDISTAHLQELEKLKAENESSKAKLLEELSNAHAQELDALRRENESSKNREIEALRVNHEKDLEALKAEHETSQARKLQELAEAHAQELERLREESEATKVKELAALSATHAKNLDEFKAEHEATQTRQLKELEDAHARELENLRQENEATKSKELATLIANHESNLASLKKDHEEARLREINELKSTHDKALASLRAEHQTALDTALDALKTEHSAALDALKKESQASQAQALDSLRATHAQQLELVKSDSDAALARELDAIKVEHANILESQKQESSAEMDRLHASHASELEALRKSLATPHPTLGLSPINSVNTEPIEMPEPRSPKREAFILPREDGEPHTPLSAIVGGMFGKGKNIAAPIIAEDDTRQSPSAIGEPETPESQRPFKELSTNTDARPERKQHIETSHQGSQTTLTSDGLERLMKQTQRPMSQDSRAEMTGIPFGEMPSSGRPAIHVRQSSQESLGGSRPKPRAGESGPVSATESVPTRRPGSSASARGSIQNRPPLPPNHREVIEAARTGSSGGGKGTMGPPMLPASAYRTPGSQPHTPAPRRPQSPASGKGTPTPRASRTPGYAEFQSPTMRMRPRSRQSSVSSFASEIDSRFGIRPEMGIEGAGFGPGTDPRMIQAITQTMIGEYLWKYTRKTGRGEISENRHRRYFWVHPYTRTLYWSNRDPSTAGRSELKAKSVPIEAVRVVADDNPMPPGLHRKSLVIVSPGRSIKFTCTTGQRHETWFNALSYLLLRTGTESQTDAEEIAGNITQDDVDEFNPPFGRRTGEGHRPRAPPSLSSYNSRTTRNESPTVDMTIPTLTPTHEKEGPRGSGTLGRLSGYWKSSTSTLGGTLTSLRRGHNPHDTAIYEASEVPDSAEDLRQIMEQQDREADRLENVRACCDGKHDVGTLSHTAKRGLLSNLHSHNHTHTHPGPSSSPTPGSSSFRSRP
ncbi:hypothetical protein F4809DRAFT_501952 [Biscogniauxia mediterranea]|nr:hypothetical protein F4809DRAFT_501952 [Biscogniauxia mediterranea]